MADLDAWEQYGVHGHTRRRPALVPVPRGAPRPRGPPRGCGAARGRHHELAHGQPAPAARVLLPSRRPSATASSSRTTAFSSDSYAVRSHVALRGLRPRHRGAAPASAPGRGHAAHRGRDRGRCIDHAHSIATGDDRRRATTSPASSWTSRPITAAGHDDRRHGRLGSRPCRRQRARCSCTTGTSTSPPGARTSTSTPVPVRSRAPSSTTGTWATPRSPRLEGWWSTEPGEPLRDAAGSRAAALGRRLVDVESADLRDGPVRTSLQIFDEVGMARAARPQPAPDGVPARRCSTRSGRARADITLVTPARTTRVTVRSCRCASQPTWPTSTERMSSNWGVVADDRQARHHPTGAGAALLHVPRLLAGRRRAEPGADRGGDRMSAIARTRGSPSSAPAWSARCWPATSAAAAITVDVYERRPDPRATAAERGRSINLALSERGLDALRRIDLVDTVMAPALPMHGRMMHGTDGDARPSSRYSAARRPGDQLDRPRRAQRDAARRRRGDAGRRRSTSRRGSRRTTWPANTLTFEQGGAHVDGHVRHRAGGRRLRQHRPAVRSRRSAGSASSRTCSTSATRS